MQASKRNKTILILSTFEDVNPKFYLQTMQALFQEFGFKTEFLNINEDNIEAELRNIIENEDIFFVFSHNLNGWKYFTRRNADVQEKGDLKSTCFVSIIDTPLNKVGILKKLQPGTIILTADGSQLSIIRNICGKAVTVKPINNPIFDHIELAGTDRTLKEMNNRPIDILFVGRLTSKKAYTKKNTSEFNKRLNTRVKGLIKDKDLLRRLKNRASKTIGSFSTEFLIKKLLQAALYKKTVQKALLATDVSTYDIICNEIKKSSLLQKILPGIESSVEPWYLNWIWGVSHYVRTKRRMRVIEEIKNVSSNINVSIVTNKPEEIADEFGPNVKCLPFQPWTEVTRMMAEAKIVINTQSQISGAHEKIPAAMANGAVVATNETPYLLERFKDGFDILFYDFKDGLLKSKLEAALNDLSQLDIIAERGMNEVLKNDMAIDHAKKIVTLVDSHV